MLGKERAERAERAVIESREIQRIENKVQKSSKTRAKNSIKKIGDKYGIGVQYINRIIKGE